MIIYAVPLVLFVIALFTGNLDHVGWQGLVSLAWGVFAGLALMSLWRRAKTKAR